MLDLASWMLGGIGALRVGRCRGALSLELGDDGRLSGRLALFETLGRHGGGGGKHVEGGGARCAFGTGTAGTAGEGVRRVEVAGWLMRWAREGWSGHAAGSSSVMSAREHLLALGFRAPGAWDQRAETHEEQEW